MRLQLWLTWAAVWSSCAVIAYLCFQLWCYIGLSHPSLLLPLVPIGIMTGPLEALVILNTVTLSMQLASHDSFIQKLVVAAALWFSHGALVGLALIIVSKFMPIYIKKAFVSISFPTWGALHILADTILPPTLQQVFGVGFTLASELSIMPAVMFLLPGTAKLKYAGENFDFQKESHLSKKRQKVLVLIHGNKFNECQWHFSRILMQARGWHEKFHIITVNYFNGPVMRDYCPETSSVAGCSKRALQQIRDEMKLRGIEESVQVVLMGHSLGGVVGSYIKEFLAEPSGLKVTNVVAIAAPLAGSALLGWAHSVPFLQRTFATHKHFAEFFPINPEMLMLRDKMKYNASSYYAITGGCDPLVRPSSALLEFLDPNNRVYIPYLGHYNIKISYRAWRHIIQHVETIG